MVDKKIIVKPNNQKIIVRASGARGPSSAGSQYLQGHGLPASYIGSSGDKYLDLDTSLLYTKSGGNWTNPVQSVARAAISYTHTQNSMSDTWSIQHNLGFQPAVSVMDFSGVNVECEIGYESENQVTLEFYQNEVPIAVSGYAYLS